MSDATAIIEARYLTCDCKQVLLWVEVPPGFGGLKQEIANRKIRKDAKKYGVIFVGNRPISRCPKCKREIDFRQAPQTVEHITSEG